MGEVVHYQPPQPMQPATQFSMNDMWSIAQAIAKGGLFGSNDPNAVLTLCMVAQAEGKHPGLVLQQYHVISGKPAKKADAMLQDFLFAGGRVEWHALTDDCADATFSHPAGGSVRISWDEARVQKAGLGNNPMHKKYPRAMKRARVVSEGVRTVFPGATSGMYVPEEAEAFDTPRTAAQERHEATVAAITAPEPDARTLRWVDGYIAKLNAADDRDTLATILEANLVHMDRLADKWSDLWQRARDAERTREQALVQEKRPDDAYGEDGE